MTSIKENLAEIYARIERAARRAGRPAGSVKLVAVSKRVPLERIQEAIDAGQRLFGENYLQEAQTKIDHFGPEIEWHFIGQLQSNKAKAVAGVFQMIETIDRVKLAKALEKHLSEQNGVQPVLIQVNIGREPQKGGVLPEDCEQLLKEVSLLPHLAVKGLMTMPPFLEPEAVRPYFRQLRQMADALAQKGVLGQDGPVELSMGMSGDFEVAIEEGATLVRVGTALFGERD